MATPYPRHAHGHAPSAAADPQAALLCRGVAMATVEAAPLSPSPASIRVASEEIVFERFLCPCPRR